MRPLESIHIDGGGRGEGYRIWGRNGGRSLRKASSNICRRKKQSRKKKTEQRSGPRKSAWLKDRLETLNAALPPSLLPNRLCDTAKLNGRQGVRDPNVGCGPRLEDLFARCVSICVIFLYHQSASF